MRYVSTRNSDQTVNFSTALLNGLAPDGGLYVPQTLPKSKTEAWEASMDFPDMAARILTPWLATQVSGAVLKLILKRALDFPVPLVKVGDVWVLELFHGPTLSFKDFGARTMSRLMNHFVKDEPLTILVATSGDTGSAVADGFGNLPNLRVAVLYPKGQVSPTQEKQLIVRRKGVRAFAVQGTFDDCQSMVKELLVSPGKLNLSAANSINVGRLLPQMLYYYWAFAKGKWQFADVCVPCGNLGNLTAGVIAHLCGLPVRKFIAAHNSNDGFPRFLRGDETPFKDSVRTLSNAMDVGRPSNFERLKFLLSDERLRCMIQGRSCSNEETLTSIRRVYEETGYIADPHTAVALAAVRDNPDPVIVLSTAHPAKFSDIVEQALGFAPASVPALIKLDSMPTWVQSLPPTADSLRLNLESWD
ncbi:MAG: threonine synthase [Bacteroidetes bacterium]|nr:threonine synthase [Bacteroidota bacterium]MCY4204147.1 threonine synthase [Bacteroidota bacterium]